MRKQITVFMCGCLLMLAAGLANGATEQGAPSSTQLESFQKDVKEIKTFLKDYFLLKLAHDIHVDRVKIENQSIRDTETELDTVNDELQNKADEKMRLNDQLTQASSGLEFDPEAKKAAKKELDELNASVKVVERQEQRLQEKKTMLEAKRQSQQAALKTATTNLETTEAEVNTYLEKSKKREGEK